MGSWVQSVHSSRLYSVFTTDQLIFQSTQLEEEGALLNFQFLFKFVRPRFDTRCRQHNLWKKGIKIVKMGTRKLFQFLTSKRTALHYSTSSKIDLSGVFPPVVTPFNADQSIAWPKLEANIEK